MNKENSKKVNNTQKDSKNNFKKPVLIPKNENTKVSKKIDRSKSKPKNKKLPEKNSNINSKKSSSELEKTKEKLTTGKAPEINVVSENITEETSSNGNLKAICNDESTNKIKRNSSEFENENYLNECMSHKFEDLIDELYSNFISQSDNIISKFKSICAKYIITSKGNYSPFSITFEGSKILSNQKFWILWIESLKTQISAEELLNLFNVCFNYVTEENLIKYYYLNTIREVNPKELLIKRNILTNSENIMITNEMLISLLESYAQFLLRLKVDKPEKKHFTSSNKKIEKNETLYFAPLKKEYLIATNTEFSYLNNQEKKELNNDSKLHLNSQSIVNETPKRQSKISSHHSYSNLISSIQEGLSSNTDECKDTIKTILDHTQKTDFCVSQYTIDRQTDYMNKLANYNNITLNLMSQQSNAGIMSNSHSQEVNDSILNKATFNADLSVRQIIKEEALDEKEVETKNHFDLKENLMEESAKKRLEDCLIQLKKTSTAKKNSKFDEEYPNNIVEGSIVEFNKSFNVELENDNSNEDNI